jgi:cysteine desulfurase/selenocysteine lyase
VHRGLHELSSRATEAYEASRQRVASYLGASSAGEIIFTRGTTESINLVAQAWGGNFLRKRPASIFGNYCSLASFDFRDDHR